MELETVHCFDIRSDTVRCDILSLLLVGASLNPLPLSG